VSEEVETAAPAATVGAQPDRMDGREFAEIYAVHAAHVFDYCCALVGSDAVAASATRAALVLARQLPQASHLLRAGLMATARQEALAFAAGGSGPPGAGAARLEAADGALGAALRQLPVSQREVLELVYRHGIWPEQLPAVLGVSARDAYARLAAAEHDFLTVAAALGPAGSSARSSGLGDPAGPRSAACPALEDIGAAPLAPVPGSVWRDAVAELTARTSVATAVARALPADRAGGSLAQPRRRLRLAVAAALPAVAVGCWAILAGVGAAHSGGGHDASEASAMGSAAHGSRSTATPDGAGTAPARQGTVPVRQGTTPAIPVLTLLPSTPAGTVLPVTTSAAAGADQVLQTSPSVSATPSSSASPSSAAPSPSESPSSAAPSPSDSASPSGSASPSDSASASDSASPAAPSPSDSPSSASPSVPDPTPAG
jgi:hypothetical protein